MPSSNNIQWFPGHMAKAQKELKKSLALVDIAAEVLDARIPFSSSNPDLQNMLENKKKIVILNKTDLADDNQTHKWVEFYKSREIPYVLFSLKNKGSASGFIKCINELMDSKLQSWKLKGMHGRKIRAMIVGIPNVGKSSIINVMAGKSRAKVENRPGVTRKNQWFAVDRKIEFLDTPGVLWPKFESKDIAYNLAFTGAIKSEILDTEDVAVNLIERIRTEYFVNLSQRFKLDGDLIRDLTSLEIINLIGKKRGMIVSGGEIDFLRVSNMLIEEFKSGKLGKITLESPLI